MSKRTPGGFLANASYRELVSFVRYFGHFGTPVIIGGWAVFLYNPYFGSVDIDVVGPSLNGAFDEIIEGYERSHGYEITKQDLLGTEIVASKTIRSKAGKKIGDMEIDACSYEQPAVGQFHEDKSKTLPYALCEKDGCKQEVSIAKDCVCYVPSKPLLTLFKVKARRDRSYDITTKGSTMNSSKLEWLRSKVAKDGSDIIALLDPTVRRATLKDKMNYEQMKALASESNLTNLVTETLQNVLEDERALSLYGDKVNSRAILKHVASLNT
jgi:hypothetical protein